MRRLILVRHAEPDERMRGICYGRLDVGLSERGRLQAARLPARLAAWSFEAVYASPRRRAVETAAPLGQEVRVVEDLREIDFGALEGMPYERAAEEHPDVYRTWMERPTEVAFPGGERYAEVRARVRAAAADIRARHESAAIVAHGGTIRTLVAEALRMADEDIFRLDVDHASISVVEWFPDGTPIVRLLNGGDTSA